MCHMACGWPCCPPHPHLPSLWHLFNMSFTVVAVSANGISWSETCVTARRGCTYQINRKCINYSLLPSVCVSLSERANIWCWNHRLCIENPTSIWTIELWPFPLSMLEMIKRYIRYCFGTGWCVLPQHPATKPGLSHRSFAHQSNTWSNAQSSTMIFKG